MLLLDYLAERQVDFETMLHPPAFTAQKRAKYLHLSGRKVAKSVLLAGPSGYLLAILPATLHIDTESLGQALGGAVRLADDWEISKVFPDCEWGVVPPFGARYGITTALDEAFAGDEWIVFEGSTHMEAIRMRCRDYERLEQPRRLHFAR